ncbi:MAG: group 1 glycosyl transferase [Candidatus Berkelbacteria bacterium Licking1014_7]|uniref:Group 1 glycosyl transferase n=1 Tax=Candidatus Berkelbacteria bacterium Licking1014_7 TaxID=2017147 RepID=A0A554LKQ8_9BACT|nr:MAG: group 1 glycosyl transferase [Candidatus Berkelbacteria bacterium Licking1014_7]
MLNKKANNSFDHLRVAIVHEILTQMGGAERVLKEFLEIFPQATIYTLIYNSDVCGQTFGKYKIITSWLQKLPFSKKIYKKLLPFYPNVIENWNLKNYDLVISLTSALVKGVKKRNPHQIHICYCNTPTRYLWIDKNFYLETSVPKILRPLLDLYLPYLKKWDFRASQRPDFYIANSREVQKRIKSIYGRESIVIYPSVETELFLPKTKKQDYYLMGGRLVPYKKYDIAIKAFNQMPEKKLIIAGAGSDRNRLEKLAISENISFLDRVPDNRLVSLYQNARAYIFPALEDFGITPLEAMSAGTPVIAYKKGGALETVIEGKTGIFFDRQNYQNVISAIKIFEKKKFSSQECRERALQFTPEQFRMKIKDFIKLKLRMNN